MTRSKAVPRQWHASAFDVITAKKTLGFAHKKANEDVYACVCVRESRGEVKE